MGEKWLGLLDYLVHFLAHFIAHFVHYLWIATLEDAYIAKTKLKRKTEEKSRENSADEFTIVSLLRIYKKILWIQQTVQILSLDSVRSIVKRQNYFP